MKLAQESGKFMTHLLDAQHGEDEEDAANQKFQNVEQIRKGIAGLAESDGGGEYKKMEQQYLLEEGTQFPEGG